MTLQSLQLLDKDDMIMQMTENGFPEFEYFVNAQNITSRVEIFLHGTFKKKRTIVPISRGHVSKRVSCH